VKNLPVIDEILKEEFVCEDKVEGSFGAYETEKPLLVTVPGQWVIHLNLKIKENDIFYCYTIQKKI
jgi:hypothetical protein